MAINKGRVFTVASVKGGTGKTTTTLNLAGIFALMGKKVLIVDLDLYSSAIALSLNVELNSDIYKLVNDLENNRFINFYDYILKYNEQIDVLASPKDPRLANKINSQYIGIVLNKATIHYDIILVDTSNTLDGSNLVAMDLSDKIVYIMTNDPVDVKNIRTIVSIYKDMDKSNYLIVLNNSVDRNRNSFSLNDIKNIIKDDVDYTIPSSFYLKNIDKYLLDGEILTLNKGIRKTLKKAINSFEMLARELLDEKR